MRASKLFIAFNKRYSRLLISVVSSIFLFFQLPAAIAKDYEIFNIGIALPLTGPAADYGAAYRNGLEMALSDNPDFKNQIYLRFEDHRFDAKQALAIVRKFDSDRKVKLIYVWGFTPSDVISPVASTIRTPLLLASINPVSKGQARVFNVESSLEKLSQPLIRYIHESGLKNIAIVATQMGALVQSAELLKRAIPEGHLVSYDTLLPEETDFRSLITRFKGKRAETIILLLAPGQIENFVQQAREISFEPHYLGGNSLHTGTFVKLFENQPEGPLFVDSFLDTRFSELYQNKFGNTSHISEAARGYFLATLLEQAVKKSKSFSPEDIIESLRRTPPGSSPAGAYSIIENQEFGLHVDFQPALYQIKNGKIIEVPLMQKQ